MMISHYIRERLRSSLKRKINSTWNSKRRTINHKINILIQ